MYLQNHFSSGGKYDLVDIPDLILTTTTLYLVPILWKDVCNISLYNYHNMPVRYCCYYCYLQFTNYATKTQRGCMTYP